MSVLYIVAFFRAKQILSEVTEKLTPFKIEFSGLGNFGAKVVFAKGGSEEQQLQTIAGRLFGAKLASWTPGRQIFSTQTRKCGVQKLVYNQ